MRIVNIHAAKTHLSRLVDQAAAGETFIIAKAGKPLVQVTAIRPAEAGLTPRCGFLTGQIEVPEDFDEMHAAEIGKMFS